MEDVGVRVEERVRVRILDLLRGFSLVSMVAYHAMFDLVHMFGVRAPWYVGLPGYIWQQSICWVFILVSGAALHYGRRPVRRGLIVLGCAVAVSVVTLVLMPQQRVMSGILHMLAICMLLGGLLRRWLVKVPPVAGLVGCVLLFAATKMLPRGYLGFFDVPVVELSRSLYQTPFLFPLGLPGPGFFSADYFPLLPWLFLFFAGTFGWALLQKRVKATPPGKDPLSWLGRHSLLIYMVHQPVIYGACLLLAQIGIL